MWLSDRTGSKNRSGAFLAAVVYSDGAGVQLSDTQGGTAGTQFLPYGIISVPPKGARAAAVEAGGRVCVVGIESGTEMYLEPGEIGLYSAGGASLVLKNDGSVYINGRRFEPGE